MISIFGSSKSVSVFLAILDISVDPFISMLSLLWSGFVFLKAVDKEKAFGNSHSIQISLVNLRKVPIFSQIPITAWNQAEPLIRSSEVMRVLMPEGEKETPVSQRG